jgi:hypothetical protein
MKEAVGGIEPESVHAVFGHEVVPLATQPFPGLRVEEIEHGTGAMPPPDHRGDMRRFPASPNVFFVVHGIAQQAAVTEQRPTRGRAGAGELVVKGAVVLDKTPMTRNEDGLRLV